MGTEPLNLSTEESNKSAPKEEELLTRPPEKEVLLEGSCMVIFVGLKDDGSAIFKPVDKEIILRSKARPGTYYRRERAAYLVSRFIGLDLVPPTVIREIGGRTGSLQEFIPDAQVFSDVEGPYTEKWKSQLHKMWIFDYLIWNSDRHGENFLVKDEKIYAIDNSLSFGEDYLNVYTDCSHEVTPSEVKDTFQAFMQNDPQKDVLKRMLRELLAKNEVDAFFARLDYVWGVLRQGGIFETSLDTLYFPKK